MSSLRKEHALIAANDIFKVTIPLTGLEVELQKITMDEIQMFLLRLQDTETIDLMEQNIKNINRDKLFLNSSNLKRDKDLIERYLKQQSKKYIYKDKLTNNDLLLLTFAIILSDIFLQIYDIQISQIPSDTDTDIIDPELVSKMIKNAETEADSLTKEPSTTQQPGGTRKKSKRKTRKYKRKTKKSRKQI